MVQTRNQSKQRLNKLYYASLYNELTDIMFLNKDFTELRNVYKNSGKAIGLEIYKIGGTEMLFNTMNMLIEDIMYSQSENKNIYYIDLRSLEMEWSNIGEWQA